MVAVGGGTQGELWTQIVSDITGRPQELRTITIGASYGGALLAAGLVQDVRLDDWNPVRATVAPRAEHTGRYDDLYTLYRRLYPATSDVVHTLATFQDR